MRRGGYAPASARTRRVGAQLAAELQGLTSRRMLASLSSIVNASGVWPNLSLNPDAPPAGARSNILARPPSRRAG